MTRAGSRGKGRIIESCVIVLLFAALIAGVLHSKRSAPTPPAFKFTTLAAAEVQARDEGKPVVAVFTARWCGACQGFKRGALADASVSNWLGDQAVAALIDIDAQPGDAEAMGVSAVPTTVLLRDGQVLARQVGAMGAAQLRDWLEQNAVTR